MYLIFCFHDCAARYISQNKHLIEAHTNTKKTVDGSTQLDPLDPRYIKHFVLYIILAYLDIFVSPKQSNRFLKELQIIPVLSKCITQKIAKEVSIYKERWRYIQNLVPLFNKTIDKNLHM